jgi:hypothetical protein
MSTDELKNFTDHQTEKSGTKTTKESILNYLDRECNSVIDGNKNGYELQFFLNNLEKKIKDIKTEIKETVFDELKDPIDWNGYKFKVTSGSGKYDFSCFEDWKKKDKEIKAIEDNMKLAYKKGQEYIDSETGEVYPIPEFKPYSNRIVITKNK